MLFLSKHRFSKGLGQIILLGLGLLTNISLSEEVQCSITASTREDALGPFYVESSPQTELMAPVEQLNDPLKRLEVTGRVLSIRDCNSDTYYPMSNVVIEAWYAGEPDAEGNFYQDDNYRGQVVTDDCGLYSFVQAFPELYPGRPIIHTHFRLSDTSNNELLVTQLYFIGEEEGYYNEETIRKVLRVDRDAQAVSIEKDANGTRRVVFDIFLDSDGNKNCPAETTNVPPTQAQEPCGILGLSIFCFNGCGIFRRLLGRC